MAITKQPHQLSLTQVAVAKEINGIEMGVLSDGTSYLSGKSLARLCGVAESSISEQASNWRSGKRVGKLPQWLLNHGIDRDSLYIETSVAGRKTYAYPDDVCMLVLEYYAFESGKPAENAQQLFRALARAGLRVFVYNAVGYDPSSAVPAQWRQFHDRMTLASAPIGYFSVFKETADFVITAIRGGFPVDEHTIPDISVGIAWGKHWTDKGFDDGYGKRIKHDHNYPEYFSQAASNPQPIWVYPVAALGEFRTWMQRTYVPEKFPKYLEGKVTKGALPASVAEVLALGAAAPEPKALNL